jgi:hypothetical protein
VILNRYLSSLSISRISLSVDLPPKSTPVLIRQFNGRIISGIVTEIDHEKEILKLSKVTRLEIIGLGSRLDSIYGKKTKINGIFEIPIKTLVYWEKLPEYLKLDS